MPSVLWLINILLASSHPEYTQMTVETACIILGISQDVDFDDLLEALELKVFDLRSFFLQQPVVPILYKSRIERLNKLQQAYLKLGGQYEHSFMPLPDYPYANSDTLVELLASHAQLLTDCRSQMAQTLYPKPLIDLAQVMISKQREFESLFIQLTEDLSFSYTGHVKQAEQPDFGRLIHDLRAGGPKNVEALLAKERQRILLMKNEEPHNS